MEHSLITKAYIVPGLPHILLAPEQSPGWGRLNAAYQAVRDDIASQDADLILYFSTQWLSILGYTFQADPSPEWLHVDQDWHELGSMPYRFKIDTDFANVYADEVDQLGYKTKLINYRGFPIDTGTIVAQKLLNPDNRLPASIVSCNMYSEKEETTRIGQAAARALQKSGKRAVAVLVSSLSHRFHVDPIKPKDDRISSKKDDEWNRKILEMLSVGDMEDVAQTVREFARQANGDQKSKGFWWLNGLLGQSNHFDGKVFAYEAVWGTGAALIGLEPTVPVAAVKLEATQGSEEGSQAGLVEELTNFDAMGSSNSSKAKAQRAASISIPLPSPAPRPGNDSGHLEAKSAYAEGPNRPAPAAGPMAIHDGREDRQLREDIPRRPADYEIVSRGSAEPVGTYPHARRYGDLLFLSGIGPRQVGSKEIPGITFDANRKVVAYDIRVQTLAVIAGVKRILEDAGSALDRVIDIQVFLTNMKDDFAGYNEIYNEAFKNIRPTRTTIEVGALPTPIAVEFKVIARP